MYIQHNFNILDTKIVGELCLALAEAPKRRQRKMPPQCVTDRRSLMPHKLPQFPIYECPPSLDYAILLRKPTIYGIYDVICQIAEIENK